MRGGDTANTGEDREKERDIYTTAYIPIPWPRVVVGGAQLRERNEEKKQSVCYIAECAVSGRGWPSVEGESESWV